MMNNDTVNPIDLIIAEAKAKKAAEVSNPNSFVNEALDEDNRYFSISMILIFVGCLGGVAVGLGALASTLQVAFLVFPVMATLSLLLAVQPMKYIMISAVIATVVDLIIITLNII